jgi:hypothetical protein
MSARQRKMALKVGNITGHCHHISLPDGGGTTGKQTEQEQRSQGANEETRKHRKCGIFRHHYKPHGFLPGMV